jgi:F0F1-type ATP synthase membrane subunit a
MSWQNQRGVTVFILLWLCFMALAVAGGIGLLLKRGRKWARTFSIVHSALSIFAIPIIGTIFGTLSIIYLAKQEVRDYFNPPPKQ